MFEVDEVRFVKHHPHPHQNSLLTAEFVEVYREVFAASPWNEWMRCPKCGKSWGLRDAEHLVSMGYAHCGVPLVDFWPRDKVHKELMQAADDGASIWLALDCCRVVGFTYGYSSSLEHLEEHVKFTNVDKFHELFGKGKKIAYQDEVGVLPSHRRRHIAQRLVLHRLEDFLDEGLEVGVVRTRRKPVPSVTFPWYTDKLGYTILQEFDDGNVLLGRDFEGLKELLS